MVFGFGGVIQELDLFDVPIWHPELHAVRVHTVVGPAGLAVPEIWAYLLRCVRERVPGSFGLRQGMVGAAGFGAARCRRGG